MFAHIKYILLLFLTGTFTGMAFGQYTSATAKLEKNNILIGDQIQMEIQLTVPSGSRVQWPMLLDTIAPYVEILNKSAIDTVSSDKDQFTLKQDLVITSFDSGSYVVRPIIFKYSQKGDTIVYFAETLPISLDVQTVEIDQAGDIKPIKPPLAAPVTFRELMPWIGLFMALVAVVLVIYYYLKRKKQIQPIITTRLNATIPPYEAAMEALESLRIKKLWQSGRVKDYYSEMTEIVREYIELRYPVRALEMTTGEINAALQQSSVNSTTREKLYQVLVLADLVKFAKEQPLPLENDLSLNQCMEFVRETKPSKEAEFQEVDNTESVKQNSIS